MYVQLYWCRFHKILPHKISIPACSVRLLYMSPKTDCAWSRPVVPYEVYVYSWTDQVMACRLTAPSHYLNHSLFIVIWTFRKISLDNSGTHTLHVCKVYLWCYKFVLCIYLMSLLIGWHLIVYKSSILHYLKLYLPCVCVGFCVMFLYELYLSKLTCFCRSNLTGRGLTNLRLDKMAAILAGYNFKCIFLNENDRIPIRILLKCVHRSPIDNKPELVQVVAWHWKATSHCLN